MCSGIIHDVRPILDGIHDRPGLRDQIDLEADIIARFGAGAEADGDDGETVDKWLPRFTVVDERDLALLVLCKVPGELGDGVLIGEFALACLSTACGGWRKRQFCPRISASV